MRPPRARHGHSEARSRACCRANPARSVSRRSHLMSGCRRTTPDAVHGTSATIRSNARPSHQREGSAASPSRTSTTAPPCGKRATFSRTRARRRAVGVERDDLDVGELGQMRGLAARRRAGIEHAHAVRGTKQRRGELRARVLHRERAFRESRKLRHRARRQRRRFRRRRPRSQSTPASREAREECVTRCPRVHWPAA